MSPQLQRKAVQINGYQRDSAGRWRYAANGKLVPGASTITLATLYRFPTDTINGTDVVLVPVEFIELDAELAWCRIYVADGLVYRHKSPSGGGASVAVPLTDWHDHSTEPITITAPELSPGRLLDIDGLAALLSVGPSTVRAYVARGQLPIPTVDGWHTPLWALPVIAAHVQAQRRRQQRRASAPSRPTRTKGHHRPAIEDDFDETLSSIDARLASLGINIELDDETETDLIDLSDDPQYSDRYTE
jgi:hypothetical protein